MNAEDQKLWDEVSASVRPLGDTSPRDPFPAAPMHLRTWASNPVPTTLDLHGLTLVQAFDVTKRFLYHVRHHRVKNVVIITGRSGAICAEFPAWAANIAVIRKIELQPNGGSFRVLLKGR